MYSYCTLSHREPFESKVEVDKFYLCSLTESRSADFSVTEAVVRVKSIFTDTTDSIICKVDVLETTENQDIFTKCPVYLDDLVSPNVVQVPVQAVTRPAHLVPLCQSLCSCEVYNRASFPHPFPFRCFALAGNREITTSSSVLNK